MSTFVSCFDLFTIPDPDLGASPAADAPVDLDLGGDPLVVQDPIGLELDALAALPELIDPSGAAESQSDPAADAHLAETSYRNDDVGIGYVMDPNASSWQDMVWVDWD